VIEFLSHLQLLIAIAPVFVVGVLVGLVGLYFARRDRLASQRARVEAKEANSAHSEEPKAAHG